MRSVFVTIALTTCLFLLTKAQNNIPKKIIVSKIDSLSKLFDAAKSDTEKINVLRNAPHRIDDFFEKPAPIINLYNKALNVAKRIGDKKSTIAFLTEIAYFQMYALVDEPQAFKLYLQALRHSEKIKDYESCAKICYELAAITEHQNLKSESNKYFLKSVEYAQKLKIAFVKPYRWLNEMYLGKNQIEEALKLSKQCVEYVENRTATASSKVLAYGILHEVLVKIPSKKQEALYYKQRIISLLSKVPKTEGMVDDIAKICVEVEQYELAIQFAKQGLTTPKVNKQAEIEKMLCYQIISTAYERQGQYEKSLKNHKEYANLYVNILRNVVSLESGRRVIQAEGERKLILKQNEIELERFYRNLSFTIAAFLVLLSGLVLFFYKREQKRKKELTHLNTTKDKLFAILSHDLRSPVGVLENNVMLTNWGALSQEEFSQMTQNLGQEVSQVRTMLDNLLQWSVSQMGGIKPMQEQIRLLDLLDSQIQLLSPAATKKSIQIVNDISETTTLLADKNHLAVIFRNLLQNAIKFTHRGGNISVKARQQQDKLLVEVRDTGIGMSKERLANLFRLSSTSSKVGTDLEQGTGLGLILVKELVEANEGSIEVNSEPNQGTLFKLYFRTSLAAIL